MDGSLGVAVEKARTFITMLASLSSVPIVEIDERLSTETASRSFKHSGVNAKDAKKQIDQLAAVAILEFALAIEKNKNEI